VNIPILVRAESAASFDRLHEPVTVGLPLPKGAAADVAAWRLADADGAPVALQANTLDRWSDGSIRWALLDFQASLRARAIATDLQLSLTSESLRPIVGGVRVVRTSGGLDVATGELSCELTAAAPLSLGGGLDLRIVGADGERFAVSWQQVTPELEGSVRSVVAVHGRATDNKNRRLDLILRYDFFSGSAVVRARLTVRNPSPAQHPGGIWELGDAGSVLLKECTLAMAVPSGDKARVSWSAEPGAALKHAVGRARIYQESSGGERWASSNHRNRAGVVPMTFRGYRVETDGTVMTGLRATPVVVAEGGGHRVGAAVPGFWQNFPRAIGADRRTLEISFFPPEFPDAHELQGGEQKTHEVFLLYGLDRVGGPPMEWCRQRLVGHLSPEWYSTSNAVPYLTPAASDPNQSYLTLVAAALDGEDTFEHKRERLDEYGWRHFGDIYGDHEAVSNKGAEPLVSHYNNQYDPVGGFAYQFMRTGDLRWWRQCRELAWHVTDIDLYHTDEDKSKYNHGLFWHTVHYVDAGLAGHRSYPRGTVGGGPASEQNYSTGLMIHYFMTGDYAAREAALGLAQFVLDIDDGTKTVFRWLARGDTGNATASASLMYQGPGRGPGNSLNALLDGYRLSGESKFLDKAEQVIRRCVHPAQNLAELNLLDAERKWFYTMFLQSLGKYLDCKAELGHADEAYHYGQHSLLHYARWMAEHEYPYLEKAEILEFPTETWPAQDMRKSEVFNYASRHASKDERSRFVERARFFFNYATTTLIGMPTRRTLARPVVLMLSFGFSRAHFDRQSEFDGHHATPWIGKDDRPAFVPQRVRATARARKLLAAVGLGLAAAAVWWFIES